MIVGFNIELGMRRSTRIGVVLCDFLVIVWERML